MDKPTRNEIQRATQAVRRLLEDGYREQLEGTYDILLDGTISEQPGSHLSERQKVTREKLVAAVAHKQSAGMKAKEAVDTYLREAAFTTLNRFVALKMLEARDLVQECVSKGEDSSGFKEFTALAPGLVAVEDKGYRLYIETLFDEIGQEVKVLFDRRDVASLLWPHRQTLLELLGILNAPELASVWAEDETIGWVYQYFNGDEERTQMRAESQAPRNSRELAVRNQFFTPRYVVQFLTDNTLGRTWYEMMQGETKLADLDYLVRRPNEVFLADGESASESDADDSELSQEELLQQTVYVPFRAKKDPRDLRILDPACGSGHFLLYAFELLVPIYEEAWSDAGAVPFNETGTQLRADYGSIEQLQRAMPELILRHNLHGVDIDPRAAQIAALALWMRAQRAHNQFEVDRADRPPITKTNIVVAEPMPGDDELVEEFADSLKPAVLGDLFKKMVEEMKLAGELGSLLKIEESIAKAVKEAEDSHRQGSLFDGELEGQEFWESADEKIIVALGRFAESAAGSIGIRRQLFAADATQGVAFIELSRKRFDVVLMNPPFGSHSTLAREYAGVNYSDTKQEIAAGFIARARELGNDQIRVGVIATRLLFFVGGLHEFRRMRLLKSLPPELLADLGYGVLDDAMVEVSATVFSADTTTLVAKGLLQSRDKEHDLKSSCQSPRSAGWAVHPVLQFGLMPEATFPYFATRQLLALIGADDTFESGGLSFLSGLNTGDDFRFMRLHWEAPSNSATEWLPVTKGGAYLPFAPVLNLVINWSRDGYAVKNYYRPDGYLISRPLNLEQQLKPGLYYSYRTTSDFCLRRMIGGTVFTMGGPVVQGPEWLLDVFQAFSHTRIGKVVIELLFGGGDSSVSGSAARNYRPGVFRAIRLLPMRTEECKSVCEFNAALESSAHGRATELPGSSGFSPGQWLGNLAKLADESTFTGLCSSAWRRHHLAIAADLRVAKKLENAVSSNLALNEDSNEVIRNIYGDHPESRLRPEVFDEDVLEALCDCSTEELVSRAVASIGGVRSATKKSFFVDRRVELLSAILRAQSSFVAEQLAARHPPKWYRQEKAAQLIDVAVGIALNRWPNLPSAEHVAIRPDDPGLKEHIWGAAARGLDRSLGREGAMFLAAQAECRTEYLRREYFDYHLKSHSESRRKAPIYWQFATPSASYSVWCYYHGLTRETFFRIVNDYVTPKVDHEERKLNALRQEAGTDPSSKQRKAIDAQETFVAELRAFATEVYRIAPLWNPNLNDGVIINFAPLWRLVPQHKPWQKECKGCWDKLCKGDYDWGHLAMHLWPERVVPKCQNDRSLAIAHGLEDEFWYEDEDGKWQSRDVDEAKVRALIHERSSSAVKTALADLLSAPAAAGSKKRKKARGVSG